MRVARRWGIFFFSFFLLLLLRISWTDHFFISFVFFQPPLSSIWHDISSFLFDYCAGMCIMWTTRNYVNQLRSDEPAYLHAQKLMDGLLVERP